MVSVKRIYMHIKGRDREREEEVLYDVIYNVLEIIQIGCGVYSAII